MIIITRRHSWPSIAPTPPKFASLEELATHIVRAARERMQPEDFAFRLLAHPERFRYYDTDAKTFIPYESIVAAIAQRGKTYKPNP